jgi:hypothetical protein
VLDLVFQCVLDDACNTTARRRGGCFYASVCFLCNVGSVAARLCGLASYLQPFAYIATCCACTSAPRLRARARHLSLPRKARSPCAHTLIFLLFSQHTTSDNNNSDHDDHAAPPLLRGDFVFGESLADGGRRAAIVDARLRARGDDGADRALPATRLRMSADLPSFGVGRRGVLDEARFERHLQSRVNGRIVPRVVVRLSKLCRYVQPAADKDAELLPALLEYDKTVQMFAHMRTRAVSFATDRAYLESIKHGISFFVLNRGDPSLGVDVDMLQRLHAAEDAYSFLLKRVRKAYKLEPKLSTDLEHLRAANVWLEDPRDLIQIMKKSDEDHERLWRLVMRKQAVTQVQFAALRQHLVVRLYVYGKVARPGAWAGLCHSDVTDVTTVVRNNVAFVSARAGKTALTYGLCSLPLNAKLRRLLNRHRLELQPLLAATLGRAVHATRADGSIVDRVLLSTGAAVPKVNTVFGGIGTDVSKFFVKFAGKHITTNLLASFQRTWASRSCSAKELAWMDYSRTHSRGVAEQSYLKLSAVDAAEQSYNICNSLVMAHANVAVGGRRRGGERVDAARVERLEEEADAADDVAVAQHELRERGAAAHRREDAAADGDDDEQHELHELRKRGADAHRRDDAADGDDADEQQHHHERHGGDAELRRQHAKRQRLELGHRAQHQRLDDRRRVGDAQLLDDGSTSEDSADAAAAANVDGAYFAQLPLDASDRRDGHAYVVNGRVRQWREGRDGRGRLFCTLHDKRADNCKSAHCVSGSPRRKRKREAR